MIEYLNPHTPLICNTLAIPTLPYGCGTLALKKQDKSKGHSSIDEGFDENSKVRVVLPLNKSIYFERN
jgi:hypothetical protein